MSANDSQAQDPVDQAFKFLNEERFEDALKAATSLSKLELPNLSKGSLQFVLGSSNNSLGNSDQAILQFLEGFAIIVNENQPALLGHFQDEIARILFERGMFNASLLFTEMAISNFELAGNDQMKDSCISLREELLFSL